MCLCVVYVRMGGVCVMCVHMVWCVACGACGLCVHNTEKAWGQ